ncbi:MAG: TMEM165/GDT1 family protein [Leptolyngbya sp. BL-A-14]
MEASSLLAYGLPQSQHTSLSHTSVLVDSDAPNDSESLTNERLLHDAVGHKDVATAAQHSSVKTEASAHFWKVFGSTFITIFLAELGDKTQVATLLMSAESHSPWSVFAGAAIALLTTSLLGVLVGQWLSSRVSPKTLDTAAGIMLALLSLWLLWDVVKM